MFYISQIGRQILKELEALTVVASGKAKMHKCMCGDKTVVLCETSQNYWILLAHRDYFIEI